MTIEEMILDRDGEVNALATIVSYNGHEKWLLDLAEKLYTIQESSKEKYCLHFEEIGFGLKYWDTEYHLIWEMLCSMFGEWGTSVRSAWLEIEKAVPCANYISDLCADMFVYDFDHHETGWSKKYPHVAKYYKETYGFEEGMV